MAGLVLRRGDASLLGALVGYLVMTGSLTSDRRACAHM